MDATGWVLTEMLLATLPGGGSNNSRSESDSFVVVSNSSAHIAERTAELCESWRVWLVSKWWQGADDVAWSPKCEVFVHGCRRSYLAAVGAGGAQTYASCQIEFAKDKSAVRRKIDVCGDGQLGIAALPHELTHLVLADLFDGRQPPRWADEGLAVLADSRSKQLLHQRDLVQAMSRRSEFRLIELVSIETYPHPSRIPAFYGQSASLAAFLLKRGDGPTLIQFVKCTQDIGYDQALRQVYAIEDLNHLERLWRDGLQEYPVAK